MKMKLTEAVTVDLKMQYVAEVAMNRTTEGNGEPAAGMIRGIATTAFMWDAEERAANFKLISDCMPLKGWTADMLQMFVDHLRAEEEAELKTEMEMEWGEKIDEETMK